MAPRIAAPTAIRAICQPVMLPVTPLKVWVAGPNRTTSAGGPGGGLGWARAAGASATAAARAAASPVSVVARRRMVRMGFTTISFGCLVCDVKWSGARDRSRVTGGERQRPVLVPVLQVRVPAGSAGAVAGYPGRLDLD